MSYNLWEKKVCEHLTYEFMSAGEEGWNLTFTGEGSEFFLVCHRCIKKENPTLVVVTDSRIEEYFQLPLHYVESIRGSPEILVNERFRLQELSEFKGVSGGIPLLADLSDAPVYHILEIKDGALVLRTVDLSEGRVIRTTSFENSKIDLTKPIEFKVSKDGSLIAIVNLLGSHGCVFDIEDGSIVMPLYRGDYHVNHCLFSYEFIEREGTQLLIHATEWNRLDITDVRTGLRLTEREEDDLPYEENEDGKYLADYFHCSLLASPGEKKLVDNGWIWSPIGAPKIFDIEKWLQDPWHTDDDESYDIPKFSHYYWDGPICWINDTLLAIYGFGQDDLNMLDAVLIYDADSKEFVSWFPGPRGEFYFDTYLYCVHKDDFSIWDINTGERLLLAEVEVIGLDPRSKTVVTKRGDSLILHSIVPVD